MRIDRLLVKDFKGFEEREFSFHPQFNPVVGVNGTGKTSVLEALSVALGGWFLALPSQKSLVNPGLRASIMREQAGLSYMKEVLASNGPVRMS